MQKPQGNPMPQTDASRIQSNTAKQKGWQVSSSSFAARAQWVSSK